MINNWLGYGGLINVSAQNARDRKGVMSIFRTLHDRYNPPSAPLPQQHSRCVHFTPWHTLLPQLLRGARGVGGHETHRWPIIHPPSWVWLGICDTLSTQFMTSQADRLKSIPWHPFLVISLQLVVTQGA